MPRIARVVAIDLPHHITQRGNYRQQIFEDSSDYQKYLSSLQAESLKYKVDILAYCLMPNHIHFIAIPRLSESLGNFFKYVNHCCPNCGSTAAIVFARSAEETTLSYEAISFLRSLRRFAPREDGLREIESQNTFFDDRRALFCTRVILKDT